MILCDNCSPRLSCSVYRNGDTRTECEFYQPMTEQEYLQSCNTEQLADVIADFYLLGYTHGHNKMDITSRTKWSEWLKQPHRKEDD